MHRIGQKMLVRLDDDETEEKSSGRRDEQEYCLPSTLFIFILKTDRRNLQKK